jgi:hypothetical protein
MVGLWDRVPVQAGLVRVRVLGRSVGCMEREAQAHAGHGVGRGVAVFWG